MRLWSLSPAYLDTKGLLALWREGLLAQNVLLGLTKGYRNHPQLARFRASADPVLAIGFYLSEVVREADKRGYRFDRSKIVQPGVFPVMAVTRGQVEFEWTHLLAKLQVRSVPVYEKNKSIMRPDVHPIFTVVEGGIEAWERV